MSRLLLFIAVAVTALSSCSVYRSGETTKTPDDVYYSPARPGAAYVEVEKKQDNGYRANDYYNNSDDQWLRRRVHAGGGYSRWSSFDDYDWNDWRYSSYANSAFSYSPYYFNNYWNNYYSWNSYYNPYCPQIIIFNPSKNPPVYSKVRTFINAYTNTNYNNTNRPLSKTSTRYASPIYNNSNNNTRTNNSLGSSIRKVFSNGNSNSGSSYYTPGSSSDRPVRSYTPSSSSSSQSSTPTRSTSSSSSGSSSSGGGGSSSGGGGAGSRPARGN